MVAVVIQGNVRARTNEILSFFKGTKCDFIIYSSWNDEDLSELNLSGIHLLSCSRPQNPGYSNRNLQRYGVYKGILMAEQLGANFVLKWRSDMLPTNIDFEFLIKKSLDKVPIGFDSRYVTCAFRNLSVTLDWFSSIPDLFGFSSVKVMKLVWNIEGIDLSKSYNIPGTRIKEILDGLSEKEILKTYCSESELYAFYRSRLEDVLGTSLSHSLIARNYMRLINHRKLKICWFNDSGGFRSISQAHQHPWWKAYHWKFYFINPKLAGIGYPEGTLWKKFLKRYYSPLLIKFNLIEQKLWLNSYKRESLRSSNKEI